MTISLKNTIIQMQQTHQTGSAKVNKTVANTRLQKLYEFKVSHIFNIIIPPTSAAAREHTLCVYLQIETWMSRQLCPTDWGDGTTMLMPCCRLKQLWAPHHRNFCNSYIAPEREIAYHATAKEPKCYVAPCADIAKAISSLF